jgi:hypothetical protein
MTCNAAHHPDHRRNTEDLLAQLGELLHPADSLATQVRLAQRRRAAARHLITHRVIAERLGRDVAA